MVTTGDDEATHWRPFRNEHERQQGKRFYPRLAEAGLAPKVIDLTDEGVQTRRGLDLREWLPTTNAEVLSLLRPRALALIDGMHRLGVCHRDLHAGNVVIVPGDQLLAIDMDWATEVDPKWPCYDLEGPSSLIPIPQGHHDAGGELLRGVWWGNRDLARWGLITMGDIFDSKPADPV